MNACVEELLRSLRRRAKRLFGLASVDRAFPGAVTFIQRFDSALRLNVHVHTLALDGVYVREDDSMGEPVFRALPAPTADEVFDIAERTAKRVVAALKKRGRAVDGLWDEGSTVDDFDPALVACYGVAARASRASDGGGRSTARR
nr:transposase [Polyangium jinanense]